MNNPFIWVGKPVCQPLNNTCTTMAHMSSDHKNCVFAEGVAEPGDHVASAGAAEHSPGALGLLQIKQKVWPSFPRALGTLRC